MERVLVFPSSLMERIGHFVGFRADVSTVMPIVFGSGQLDYLDRARAEDDPSFKQIVPYVLLRHGDRLFCYSRSKKGTESRLHDRLSVGVGGHVNPVDGRAGYDAYLAGMQREVDEEVALETTYRASVVGCVHDDTTPVGSVHFGIIHVFDLDRPAVKPREEALAKCGFRTMAEIASERDRLESWSRFAFDGLCAGTTLAGM